MTAQTTTLTSEWMKEMYTPESIFRPYQEFYTPMLSDLDECPDYAVTGRRWNVPLYISTAWNVRTGPEGGGQAGVESDVVRQGQVYAQEFKGTVMLTELLNVVGTAGGHFNGGALNHQVKQRTEEMSKNMQIHFWGHGTGRIGIVDEGVTSTWIPVRSPLGVFRMFKGMRVDIYDLDAAGAKQIDSARIVEVDYTTRADPGGVGYNTTIGRIKLDSSVTVTAGWSIYPEDDYGYAPNGIDGLVGNLSGTFLEQSKTTYPELQSHRLHASGVPRSLTEGLMRLMSDMIWRRGCEISEIRGNAGMESEFAALQSPDKRYNVVGGKSPKYSLGHKEGDLLFSYDRSDVTIRKDPQCGARTFYFLSFKDTFHKHTSYELDFLKRGSDDMLEPVPSSGGGGFDYVAQARMWAVCNISCKNPQGNGVLEDLKDYGSAGDS